MLIMSPTRNTTDQSKDHIRSEMDQLSRGLQGICNLTSHTGPLFEEAWHQENQSRIDEYALKVSNLMKRLTSYDSKYALCGGTTNHLETDNMVAISKTVSEIIKEDAFGYPTSMPNSAPFI